MAGFSTQTNEHLIRSNLWSAQLKDYFEDDLMGTNYVRWITDFPDGDTLNIPSVGQAEVSDYAENQAAKYTAMDTGNFTFSVTEYKQSGNYMTEKMKQDSWYASQVLSSFVPKQRRAIMAALETDIMEVCPDGQTASDLNAINGASHRWVASGTNETIIPEDFARALYAFKKASVPAVNLIAIVDPSVEYALSTMTNLVNLSHNKSWEGIVAEGATTGMRFLFNVYGFDVYTSNFLKGSTGTAISETIAGSPNGTAVTSGVANLFFSATPEALPMVGLIRQPPKVDSEFNKDYQRDEYLTTARWGLKLYRPESVCVILSDNDQV